MIRLLVKNPPPVKEMAIRFSFSLLPIVLVYHAAHYFTLLFSQGLQVFALISDPFGWGWNLFGSKDLKIGTIIQAGTVWHTQVGLIIIGHIAAVYIAHLEALKMFMSSRSAALSQIPMLSLMMILTAAGLWILSLPISNSGAG